MGKRKCKQCGEEFTLTDSEIKFFKDKNLDLPKRCSECRKENKNNDTESCNEKMNKVEQRSARLCLENHFYNLSGLT